jgi:hypothetical protein
MVFRNISGMAAKPRAMHINSKAIADWGAISSFDLPSFFVLRATR